MLTAIAFGIAVGMGVQAMRQWPADGPVTPDAVAVMVLLAVGLAWFGGRSRRGPSSSATAIANATAGAAATGNTVQLFVGRQDAEQGPAGPVTVGGIVMPGETTEWLSSTTTSQVGEAEALDQLEGLDASELAELIGREPETEAGR